METEQRALTSFVRLHGSRLKHEKTKERVAYMVSFSETGIPLDVPLEPKTVEELCSILDTESIPVRWLIQQVQTYDQDSTNVLGIIFSRTSVLAHAIKCGTAKSRIDLDIQ